MRSRLFTLAVLFLTLPLAAHQDAPKPKAALDSRLRHAREALEREDLPAAARHAQAALIFGPTRAEVLELCWQASAGDRNGRALWAHHVWATLADREGHAPKRSKLAQAVLALTPGAGPLAEARVAAVQELAKLARDEAKRAKRAPEHGLVAEWAARLGTRIAQDSPKLAAAHAAELDASLQISEREQKNVIDALGRLRSGAHARSEYELAVRAALIMRGLASQGSDKDLRGDVPSGIDALKRKALEALAESRRKLEGRFPDALTVDELEEMDELAARAFSLAHTDLASPGIAVSPGGRYRIETSCGYETLLGIARAIEQHHKRLALWFGQDPFLEEPGTIRVLPESAGLETEGAPFWWAGGFQSGSITTARFTCSSVEAFGGLLTHELTHRFDGAIYPGMPSWLAEGKAVWTGGSYENSRDEEFLADYINFGTVEAAWIDGYGGEEKLRELIEGEIEEYRDNYVAGYALFVFLRQWQEPDGNFIYASRLEEYMQGLARHTKKPLAWFVEQFADGEDSRPEDFSAFAQAFNTFMAGFYWDDRADWTDRYSSKLQRSGGPWVYDTPTWSWARQRAEPFWGQDHAQAAGDLLGELGKTNDAVAAYLWAWTVDERSPRLANKLAMALEASGDEDAAWVVRNRFAMELRYARDPLGAEDPAPLSLAKTRDYAALLGQQAAALSEAGLERAASAMRADGVWLERSLGGVPPGIRAAASPAYARHPWDRPAQLMGLSGWQEASLTGYDKRRAQGCWYVEADGDLHVGRFRPRESTGTLDRTAHNRQAYTRSKEFYAPGRYAISCKVQFTTSYVSGALILGDTRRDRNIRLQFSAGDFFYSIGKSEEAEELESVGWSINGLRERDGGLMGASPRGALAFDTPRTNFELLAVVDGATVHFWIEKQYLGAYHDALGTPIEGHIGFATRRGAIRVIEPTIQHLDRSREAHRPLPLDVDEFRVNAGLDLAAPPQSSFRGLRNLPVRGITPRASGSLLVWVPMEDYSEEFETFVAEELTRKVSKYAEQLLRMLERAGAETGVVFAVPGVLDDAQRAALQTELAGVLLDIPCSVVPYAWSPPDPTSDAEPAGAFRSWLCFVDSAGVLRAIDRFYGFNRKLPDELLHWVTVFRDEQ